MMTSLLCHFLGGFCMDHTSNHLVLIPKSTFPVPERLHLHGTKPLEVIIAVFYLGRCQRKGSSTLMTSKGVYTVWTVKFLAYTDAATNQSMPPSKVMIRHLSACAQSEYMNKIHQLSHCTLRICIKCRFRESTANIIEVGTSYTNIFQ